ncbi:MAG: M24 family metallopeptidase [bacterium]
MSTLVRAPKVDRLERALRRLGEERLDALAVLKAETRTYLTGFTGSAGIAVLAPARSTLLVDFRYEEQAAAEATGWAVHRVSNLLEGLDAFLQDLGAARVGLEADTVTVAQWRKLGGASGRELVALEGLDRLRWRKDPEELALIRRAARIADDAFAAILSQVRPGVTEGELAAELEYRMRRAGAERAAFETIVASGPRSALPHGRASDRRLGRGDIVTVDFGAVVGGYHSDCTRTFVLGAASAEQREVYAVVREALEVAEAGIRPGLTGRQADALARERIAAAGYGEAFGHGLGHGVGLAVHEGPTLSPREEAVLEEGVVVTIEPGIYRPGWGGVRIEDLVVLEEDGPRSLIGLRRELLEL